jgi:hypothetical protein
MNILHIVLASLTIFFFLVSFIILIMKDSLEGAGTFLLFFLIALIVIPILWGVIQIICAVYIGIGTGNFGDMSFIYPLTITLISALIVSVTIFVVQMIQF